MNQYWPDNLIVVFLVVLPQSVLVNCCATVVSMISWSVVQSVCLALSHSDNHVIRMRLIIILFIWFWGLHSLSIFPSFSLSLCLSVCPSLFLVWLSLWMSFFPSVSLSVPLSGVVALSLYVCLFSDWLSPNHSVKACSNVLWQIVSGQNRRGSTRII